MAKQGKQPNRLVILLGVLAVLAVVVFLMTDPLGWFKPSDAEREQREGVSKVLCDFEAGAVSAFAITQPGGESFKLVKEKDKWYVVSGTKKYKADMERVQKLLDSLPGLSTDGIASEDAASYATYEVDGAKAFKLEIYTAGDKPEVELLVGKADSSMQSSFVRIGTEKPVYRTSLNVKSLIGFGFNDYRTRKPWAFDPQAVTAVSIKDPKSPAVLALVRKDGIWQKPDGSNANQTQVSELLKKLSELQISSFEDAPDEAVAKLGAAPVAVKVTTPDGDYQLRLGAVVETQAYAADQDKVAYLIYDYSLAFYRELDFAGLGINDTPPAQSAPSGGAKEDEQPDEGIKGNLKSEAEAPK
jgi:hypothetical protein